MTAFLMLNGIAVPVLNEQARCTVEEIGDNRRAVSGAQLMHRRAFRRTWDFTLQHSTYATALAFTRYIRGEGHSVPLYNSSLYTTKGGAPSSASGYTFDGAVTNLGAATLKCGTGSVVYANATTVSVYASTDGVNFEHYMSVSGSQKWVGGVRNDSATLPYTHSGSTLTFPTSASKWYDGLAFWPFDFPTDWPAQMTNFTPLNLGRLTMTGTITDSAEVAVYGMVEEAEYVQGKVGSSYAANNQTLSFSLIEV